MTPLLCDSSCPLQKRGVTARRRTVENRGDDQPVPSRVTTPFIQLYTLRFDVCLGYESKYHDFRQVPETLPWGIEKTTERKGCETASWIRRRPPSPHCACVEQPATGGTQEMLSRVQTHVHGTSAAPVSAPASWMPSPPRQVGRRSPHASVQ